MSEFLGSIWWMVVTLGVLVTFHEFGHYWVARRCGVKVLRFSVGFGRALWSRTARSGTEYVIAALPLGGYVKMLDAREGEVDPDERAHEFTAKPVWKRIAIVAAGPAFNLLFALAAFWAMFVIGKPDYLPEVGRAQALAAQAGIHAGDRVRAIDGNPVDTWTGLVLRLGDAAMAHRPVDMQLSDSDGTTRHVHLALDKLPDDLGQAQMINQIGLVPRQMLIPPVIGKIEPGSAAAAAHLQAGDRITRVGGTPIHDWNELVAAIGSQAASGHELELRVRRGSDSLQISAQPHRVARQDGSHGYLLGVTPQSTQAHYDTVLRRGPLAAIPAAFAETWNLTGQTFSMLGHMFSGSVSLNNLSGPISIAQYANASAQLGTAWFMYFLGIISLSLAIMNLLPIPILDGGHLLYYLIEIIKGSPVSEQAMIAGQYVGMLLLAALMGLAFYNDILRLVS